MIFFAIQSASAQVVFKNPYLEKILMTNSEVDELLEECTDMDDLKALTLNKDHTDPSKGTFTYYYKYMINDPRATTIVFLPGGPGGGSMTGVTDEANHLFADESINTQNFNYIWIDPRGTSCNIFAKGDFPENTVTSEQTALDIIEVIVKENIKNYIIYGESYGTLLGTILASQINKKTMPQPKAVVLEGTLAKAYSKGSGYAQSFADKANLLLDRHPELAELLLDNDNLPLNGTSEGWANFLANIPPEGLNGGEDEYSFAYYWQKLLEIVHSLRTGSDLPEDIDSIVEDVSDSNEMQESAEYAKDAELINYIETALVCKEISPEVIYKYLNFDLVNGRVVFKENPLFPDMCLGYTDKKLYSSKNYPFNIPTIYIQGDLDPQTEIKGAKEHYKSNKSTKKVFIEVKDGGHAPRAIEMKGCFDKFLRVIDQDPNLDFSKILDSKGHCL